MKSIEIPIMKYQLLNTHDIPIGGMSYILIPIYSPTLKNILPGKLRSNRPPNATGL